MKCDNVNCVIIGLIMFEIFAIVNGYPKKMKENNEIIEVSTLKIITLRPEDVNLPPVVTESTKAPTLRRLDDVDQSDSPMYKIKSLDGYRPRMRRQRKKDQEKKQEQNIVENHEKNQMKNQDKEKPNAQEKIEEKTTMKKLQENITESPNRNEKKLKQEDGIIVPVMVVQMAQPPQPRPRNPRKPPKKP